MAEFKFFADTHIPLAAIDALGQRGIDVLRSIDAGFAQNEDDDVLLDYAAAQERVLITCDHGFEKRCYQRRVENQPHTSVLYLNMANGDCQNISLIIQWVELIYAGADPETERFNQFWRAK